MELINFILTYFLSKDLYLISCFICWPPDRITQLWRTANELGLRMRVYNDLPRSPTIIPYDWHPEAMLLDLDCHEVESFLRNVSSSRGFNYRHSWLLLHGALYNRNIIQNVLEDYEILPDADVVWSAPNNLLDVYKIKPKYPYLISSYGLARNCSSNDLWALRAALPTTVTRRKNLRNVTMLGATVVTFPELFRGWGDVSTRQTDTFPKFTHPIMLVAGEDLNIHYNLRQVDLYGVSTNGSFSGVAGMLQRQEIEVAITTLFMRPDRMEVMHFISETVALTCAFIFRQPPRSAVSNVFVAPFSSGVWISCGLVVIFTAVALVLIMRVRQITHQKNSEALQALTPLTVSDMCTFILGTMCQQGFHITPSVSSIRVVMFSALLTSLFLFTSYSANIVTLLQTPSTALRTYDDLTKSPMTLAEQDSTYKKVYFTESPDPAARRMYRRKILPQGNRAFLSVEEGIENVRTKLFAFSVERSAAYDVIKKTYTEREKCALDEIDAFQAPMVCIPIKKYSGYRELFSTRLRWQREVGLMNHARRVWLVSRPRCESQSGDFVSIGITDVLPALQVIGLGGGLAIALLFVELAVHALMHKKSKYFAR